MNIKWRPLTFSLTMSLTKLDTCFPPFGRRANFQLRPPPKELNALQMKVRQQQLRF